MTIYRSESALARESVVGKLQSERGTSLFREFSKRQNDDTHQLEVPNRHLKLDLDL